MLPLLLAGTFLLCTFVLGMGFIVWMIRQWFHARKYRELVAMYEAMPKEPRVPGWTISYKEGRVTKTITVPGATEQEAMRNFIKTPGARFDAILSITETP